MVESPVEVAMDFISRANAIYGLYLDTSMAIGNLSRTYSEYHAKHLDGLVRSSGAMTEERVNPTVIYSAGSENAPRPLHQTTFVDLIERNGPEGRHMRFLAHMCIVALYQFWEDSYRHRLATALGMDGNNLKHDALGELRHLRRSIVHRGGKAVPELSDARCVPSFQENTEVVLDYEAMERVVTAVKDAVFQLATTQNAV